ncbi:TetR/AcrR family transcriptional regulator [Nocardiopsis sediminis]|uniref:TetR/AcrR family transcriptional regulator n=1 Tax=Nocardiopsis sediminis TaxID=1778267 RepID=A0ABV8FI34_9ACTN
MVDTQSAVQRLLADESGRRPRLDAQRNVERLVVAARVAVAEVGVDVTAHEIARRAGVGVGTFYRRVPSREALLEAVLSEVLGELVGKADRALEHPDPWEAFCGFATDYVRLRTESCGINDALGGDCALILERPFAELRVRMRKLVERAQEAGAMRTDVAWEDLPFMLAAVATVARTLGMRSDKGQWDRNLQIVLDGLRTDRPSPLPGTPPVIDAPVPAATEGD